ncbi:TIGR03899 family protein [Thalassotalea ganghwensis]
MQDANNLFHHHEAKMKVGKTSTPIITEVGKVKHTQQTEKIEVEEPAKQQAKASKAGPSSQLQLLNLAKQFVLDGALLSPENKAPLEDRTQKRERYLRLRKQQNLEAIIAKAIQYCSDSEITDRADIDWFNSFTEFAEGVSNPTMQDLWAKILAYEVTKPGSFSLKTLKAFRTMSISEARLFAKACAVAVKGSNHKSYRIISGSYQLPGVFNFFSKERQRTISLSRFGLSYSEFLTLADNHLLFMQETETAPMAVNETIHFYCNGEPLILTAKQNNCLLSFYKFTGIGVELANLIPDEVDNEYLTVLKQQIGLHFDIKP